MRILAFKGYTRGWLKSLRGLKARSGSEHVDAVFSRSDHDVAACSRRSTVFIDEVRKLAMLLAADESRTSAMPLVRAVEGHSSDGGDNRHHDQHLGAA